MLVLVVYSGVAFAEEKKPDFRHYSDKVDISTFSETVGEQLAALEGKEKLKVRCFPAITPAQFEEVATWSWLTYLLVKGDEQVVSLEPLSKLTNLEELILSQFQLDEDKPLDATPLGKLKKLKRLHVSSTPLKNWDALASCTKLEDLDFHTSRVSSLEFLRSTPEVKVLDLYGYQHSFPDYKPVASLKKLESLDIYMNRQAVDENLAVLKQLTSLKMMSMANCRKVTTLEFLSNCKDLEILRATWAKKLTDIDVL